ncbi:MAG: hypothetical protein GX638_07045 [Crenarchaeota archaeon]|nr:hypothetical protein [Thermoproteota archaeon]
MAFVHCHNCKWDNGDFGYGAKYHIKEAFRYLWPFEYRIGAKRTNTECWWPIVIPTKKMDRWGNKLYIHVRKLIWISDENKIHYGHRVFIPFIRSLRVALYYHKNQIYKTWDEYKNKNPDRICPKCGAKGLDID